MSRVLVVNAGSTTLKLSVVEADGQTESVDAIDAGTAEVDAVAHRVVHGGARFREPVLIDDAVEGELAALADLAPLHNTPAVRAIADARKVHADIPQVAVFDTAFHASLPPVAATYAVPARWRDEWAVRRYGFHGLSLQWASERVPVHRLVVCHLGGGCSVTAVLDGRSVETTMGFSPLEGVPMATRSGSIDAEIVLHLLRRRWASAAQVEEALEHGSGLLGLSGISSRVEELEASDQPQAAFALDVFSYRVSAAVAACAVALGGLDALVFTAGVGEGSPSIRAAICARLAFLGIVLDERSNRTAVPDAEIAPPDAPVRVSVIAAREDLVAARATRRLLDL